MQGETLYYEKFALRICVLIIFIKVSKRPQNHKIKKVPIQLPLAMENGKRLHNVSIHINRSTCERITCDFVISELRKDIVILWDVENEKELSFLINL